MAIIESATDRFLVVNRSLAVMLGYGPEELLGRSFFSLTQSEDLNSVGFLGLRSGEISEYRREKRYLHKDGHTIPVRLHVVSLPPNAYESARYLSIVEDITEVKRREEEIRASEAHFRTIFEGSVDAIFIHDEQGRILACNAAASRSTGYSVEELLGLTVRDLAVDLKGDRDPELWLNLAPSESFWTLGRARRKDGSMFPLEIRAGLLGPEPSRRIIAVMRDISDREHVQDAEFRARKAESLVLMAGGIAHDFNNIFGSLNNYLELASREVTEARPVRDFLELAKSELRRAVGLSWKMLDFSGHGYLQVAPLDLKELLTTLRPCLEACFDAEARLEFDLDDTPRVEGDRDKLQQAIQAIVDNAREALPPGGRMRIRLSVDFGEDPHGPLAPGVWPAERPSCLGTVCLEIADQGPGVPPESLGKIFDPFFSTKDLARGLGLASALGILKAHQAGVHAFNAAEGGFVLRIHFPPATA
jgi:PAS domain S-box-containing protein